MDWKLFTEIAQVAVLLGSSIAAFFSFSITPRRLRNLDAKLTFVNEQIANLYGPLMGVILEADFAYRTCLTILGVSFEKEHELYDYFDSDVNNEEDSRARLFEFVNDTYLIPFNNRKIQIITANRHLLGPAPPNSVDVLTSHVASYNATYAAWKQGHIKTKEQVCASSPVLYPPRLRFEVEAKLKYLRYLQIEYQDKLNQIRGKWIPIGQRSTEVRELALAGVIKARKTSRPDHRYELSEKDTNYGPYTLIEMGLMIRMQDEMRKPENKLKYLRPSFGLLDGDGIKLYKRTLDLDKQAIKVEVELMDLRKELGGFDLERLSRLG